MKNESNLISAYLPVNYASPISLKFIIFRPDSKCVSKAK